MLIYYCPRYDIVVFNIVAKVFSSVNTITHGTLHFA